MSGAQQTGEVSLDALIAGIRRDLADAEKLHRESRKFLAEQEKLSAEREMLGAERDKLTQEALKLGAERLKLNRDGWLAVVALLSGLLGVATLILHVLGRV